LHLRTRRIALLGAAIAVTLTIAGCSSPSGSGQPSASNGSAAAQEPIDIVAGVATSMSSIDLLLGIQQGFFKEQGLNVTTVPVQTGAGGVTQLVSNQIQVALGGLSGTITAVSQGIPIVFVSGGIADTTSSEGTWYGTLVSPDSGIKSFKDLAGKKVALNSVNCCWDFWTREAVAKDGGDQSRLQMVQLPFAQQAAALKAGQVDAITTQQPFVKQAELQGFVSLGDPAAIAYGNPKNGNTDYFMAKKFVNDHPDVVKRWRAALQKSADYANANPDQVRKIAVDTVKLDSALVAATPTPNYVSALDTDAIQKEAGWLVKYGVISKAPDVKSMIVP
jgi:NitT/TauT family transport system substrate-binding protein